MGTGSMRKPKSLAWTAQGRCLQRAGASRGAEGCARAAASPPSRRRRAASRAGAAVTAWPWPLGRFQTTGF